MSRLSYRSSPMRPNSRPPSAYRPKSALSTRRSPDVTSYGDYLPHPPRPHTSFHYYPEDEDPYVGFGDPGLSYEDPGQSCGDPGLSYEDPGQSCGDPELRYGPPGLPDPVSTAWAIPEEQDEDPEPLKLVKKYGYGYRKPVPDLGPHWSQWPQQPQSARSVRPVTVELSPRPPYSAREPGRTSLRDSVPEDDPSNMAATMAYGDRNIIMNRGLSPRRAAPPSIPGRTLTHYGSFGNRQNPNPYIGALDLQASPYNANRGFNQGITSYSSRQSRPMHRHMRTASKGEDYLHNHSIFYSTTPMVTGYFIIHPDWVSERLSLKRSQSLLSF